jgi:Arc/MetJ family transcription regulator
MRTTITLDADTRLLVERAMRERGLSFKDAVNQAIRAGLGQSRAASRGYTTPRSLGPARLELTKALSIAGQLEDQALVQRLTEGR